MFRAYWRPRRVDQSVQVEALRPLLVWCHLRLPQPDRVVDAISISRPHPHPPPLRAAVPCRPVGLLLNHPHHRNRARTRSTSLPPTAILCPHLLPPQYQLLQLRAIKESLRRMSFPSSLRRSKLWLNRWMMMVQVPPLLQPLLRTPSPALLWIEPHRPDQLRQQVRSMCCSYVI